MRMSYHLSFSIQEGAPGGWRRIKEKNTIALQRARFNRVAMCGTMTRFVFVPLAFMASGGDFRGGKHERRGSESAVFPCTERVFPLLSGRTPCEDRAFIPGR